MFDKPVIDEVIKVAKANGIKPARLLAVVEVESAGKAMEPADNKTPRLLFERHIFYRELKKRQSWKLQDAVNRGLAIPKWSRATQYKDQGTSQGRLRLLASACSIDEECAVRSCSWGVGQTMGFLAEELGFDNARDMLSKMVRGGIPAQVDCMVREIRRKGLDKHLDAGDYKSFARGYNGTGYAANQYDTRIAAAVEKWEDALNPDTPETGETPIDPPITRAPEADTPPMSKSTIGTGATVAGGAAGAGILSTVMEEVSKLPSSIFDMMIKLVEKPYFWAFLASGSAAGFIYYRRFVMKREEGI